jgi:ribosomal protein L37AE/L43A
MDIALKCPQCAAKVSLEEDASVFRCEYCESTLMPTGRNEVQSFFFPPKGTKEQVGKALQKSLKKKMGPFEMGKARLVYAPYWRVKGLLFQHAFGRKYENTLYGGTAYDFFKKIRAVTYNRTFPAFTAVQWEVFSLGLRAEALKMWPYSRESMGKDSLILEENVSLKEAVTMARKTPYPGGSADREKIELLHTRLIGARYSLLYFPFFFFFIKRGEREILLLVDGLSHKVIKGELAPGEVEKQEQRKTVPYSPLGFIPFTCPNCGWDLPYRPKARVHLCRTCGRAWQEAEGRFQEVFYRVCLPKKEKRMESFAFLPFWTLIVHIVTPGREYRNLKDFYELFPLPRVMDQQLLEKRQIRFLIPAFRIRNAAAVDRFATQMARTQPEFEEAETETFRGIEAADVWLPRGEAMEMANILLYSMIPKRAKKIRKTVKEATLRLAEGTLFWLPFREKGIFLREAVTDFAIQKNCLVLE